CLDHVRPVQCRCRASPQGHSRVPGCGGALCQRNRRCARAGAAVRVEAPQRAAERAARHSTARREADVLPDERGNFAHHPRLVGDVRAALAWPAQAHQGPRGGEAMTTSTPVSETQTFTITEEIKVAASLDQTFDSLIAQMGRYNETPDGTPLPMVLEPHPGGRWYRHLGGDNGHLWGFVQSIKRPALLEIWGPLFMSTAATSNLLYRLSETPEGTLIKFTHTLVGPFPEDHRSRLASGWTALHARVRKAAEDAAR